MMEEDAGGSPVCLAHMLVNGRPVDPQTVRDVARFRKAERVRLMDARQQISGADRAVMTAALVRTLTKVVKPRAGLVIAGYWPIRGEPDLRGWMEQIHNLGATVLLPVVVAKNAPLVFRTWTPSCAMERDIWNIPVPAEGAEVIPEVVISPLVGVDKCCFRLGNGGGYYDRTLARLETPAQVIGVGFPSCQMLTIFPMPWDIPLDCVVLADGSVCHRAGAAQA